MYSCLVHILLFFIFVLFPLLKRGGSVMFVVCTRVYILHEHVLKSQSVPIYCLVNELLN